jgi:membrane protein
MDTLWGVRSPGGILGLLKQRSYAFVTIIVSGFLFLISMLVSAGVAAAGKYFGHLLPIGRVALENTDWILSIALNAALCAILFKSIPKVPLQWKDVIPGAVFTSILLTLGKAAIGFYLGKAGLESVFGAAGSVVLIMVWIYYSAQLFFFGAEFVKVYAGRHGSKPALPNHE